MHLFGIIMSLVGDIYLDVLLRLSIGSRTSFTSKMDNCETFSASVFTFPTFHPIRYYQPDITLMFPPPYVLI